MDPRARWKHDRMEAEKQEAVARAGRAAAAEGAGLGRLETVRGASVDKGECVLRESRD